MIEIFSIALIFSTIRFATPLLFAALGGMFSERSGVINIALEGLMLAGAFTAAVVTYETGNPFLGFACGMIAGAILAFFYA
ncbi:MAG: ABC transporter permease, partial [Pyrinomonadaceae bacterium]